MNIRNATEKDKSALFNMVEEMATSYVPEYDVFKRSFDDVLKREDYKVIVAEENRDLIGYIFGHDHLAFFANGKISVIDELFVNGLFRRRGVGRRLVLEFEKWANDRGAKEITVPTRRAADFYRAVHFEESATLFIRKTDLPV